jgi:short-subunit dehydrogenase
MDLAEKVIWITGASSGIGEALVKNLAQYQVNLILSARRKEELERVKDECQNCKAQLNLLPLDLEDSNSLKNKVEEAISLFGHIDIMIHNAGISQRSIVKDTSLEVDRKIMEVNFFGTVSITKYLLPYMLDRRSGYFVVVTSLVGKFGSPFRSAYSASKHALHGFFDSLRAELGREGIKVTMVCPGFIKTHVSINALTEIGEKQNKMDNAQLKGMSADECAKNMISAIIKQKEEVYIGGKEVYGVIVKRLFPKLFSAMISKVKVT